MRPHHLLGPQFRTSMESYDERKSDDDDDDNENDDDDDDDDDTEASDLTWNGSNERAKYLFAFFLYFRNFELSTDVQRRGRGGGRGRGRRRRWQIGWKK